MQGDLEGAFSKLLRAEVGIVVAGRTDAGVHALGQVVGIQGVADGTDLTSLQLGLNRICGPSIVVFDIASAPVEWSARFDARSRTYVYAVSDSDLHDPWLAATSLHLPGALDLGAMNEAAGHLVGSHDFSSFGRLPDESAPPRRHVFELSWARRDSILLMTIRANAFIQQMARSIAGTLLEVGSGKRSPDDVPGMLAARDRTVAGRVAPAHGLCLLSVEYDEGWSGPFDPST